LLAPQSCTTAQVIMLTGRYLRNSTRLAGDGRTCAATSGLQVQLPVSPSRCVCPLRAQSGGVPAYSADHFGTQSPLILGLDLMGTGILDLGTKGVRRESLA